MGFKVMRIGTPGFIPTRLTEAREARRIATKSALARRLGVSPTSVSRWEDENADQSPDYATLNSARRRASGSSRVLSPTAFPQRTSDIPALAGKHAGERPQLPEVTDALAPRSQLRARSLRRLT